MRKSVEQVATESFVKFPQLFFGDKGYKDLSWQAKALYAFLANREQLSIKNKWIYDGKVYVLCTIETIMQTMNCARMTAIKLKKELASAGLIEEYSPAGNRANYIFVHTLSVQSLDPSVQSLDPIKTNIKRLNNKDLINNTSSTTTTTNNIYSITEQEFGRLLSPSEIEELSFMIDENKFELVEAAIRETRLSGVTNLKYTAGILRNWRDKNITTIEQVKAEKERHSSKRNQKPEREATEYDKFF